MKTTLPAIALMIASLTVPCAAEAALGGIGGPAIGRVGAPKAAGSKKENEAENATGQADEGDSTKETVSATPLATVVFNRGFINFRQVIGNALAQNERDNPGSNYELVSSIPSISANSKKQERMNRIYGNNLNTVRAELQRLGVDPAHIRMRTEMRLDDKPQEVTLYVLQ